ncbi:hypothetical protein [Methanosarcina mazei]|jgi:hypothetical protein|uniref:Uncharacterized protein n=2 Tax=Methanosarcina mazei TaxID=2209 RepID=A0A0F8K343_METMZ|nr:hypothetical protein [Methanosarcina mazei]AKB72300.1 hypothetical protein MSMAC_2410 [Methanosarcina mazei C16]KKG13197.1 hypothetical protein DU34_05405 [Methanosarcina mazei]KKG75380.1 hypothetical protein DU46_02570 [Methanosarcina mazei]KKG86853.1 hypothetical protein DU61_19355 [Methanosarcina mazei]KKH05627.1 hypothetical protein DU51_01255 [Methanosarcina mazei]
MKTDSRGFIALIEDDYQKVLKNPKSRISEASIQYLLDIGAITHDQEALYYMGYVEVVNKELKNAYESI